MNFIRIQTISMAQCFQPNTNDKRIKYQVDSWEARESESPRVRCEITGRIPLYAHFINFIKYMSKRLKLYIQTKQIHNRWWVLTDKS